MTQLDWWDALLVVGVGSLSYGAHLIYHPLLFIVPGVAAIYVAVRLSR